MARATTKSAKPTAKPKRPKRILLKVSGEALMGAQDYGLDKDFLDALGAQLADVAKSGVQLAIVCGGGNIFRGVSVAAKGGDRIAGDQMGMLATVMNCLALADAIRRAGVRAKIFSNLPMESVADTYTTRHALTALEDRQIILCAGGTGNPYFTTDTAAALKAAELKCDVLVKATQVDGIYTADPRIDDTACRFDTITHDEVIKLDLKVMDTAAFALARENKIPIIVYALNDKNGLSGVLDGETTHTRVG